MTKDHLQQELDKKKFFVVRFAVLINLVIIAVVLFTLSVLNINGHSIFSMFVKYYLK